MSVQITTAMVDMFSANVMHLAQQKESRLRQFCRQETQRGEKQSYDRIGTKEAQLKSGRHSSVNYQDTPHSRRWVSVQTYYDADMVDREDKLRVIQNPESEYAKAIGAALGRKTDSVIIGAALGTAYTGRSGASTASLANANKIAAFVSTENTGSGLNVDTLRAVRKKFKQNEACRDDEKLIFVCAAEQVDNLLGETQTTSSDYAAIKALVDGDVNYFMGFTFVRTELLPFTTADVTYNVNNGSVGAGTGTLSATEGRRCFAMTNKSGVLCAMGPGVQGKIDPLPQMHYAHQVYAAIDIGAVRMEEVQVVEVLCKEV